MNSLIAILNDDSNAFVKAVRAISKQEIKFAPTVGQIKPEFEGLKELQTEIEAAQSGIMAGQRAAADGTLKSANELADIQTKGLSDQAAAARTLFENQRQEILTKSNQQIKELEGERDLFVLKATLMGMEVSAIVQAFERKKEQIEKDRDEALAANKAVHDANMRATDRLRSALESISGRVTSGLESAFVDLNDALIAGTLTFSNLKDGFNDFATALVKDIQRIFFTETIAKPAAGFLAKSIGLSTSAEGGPVRKMASGGMLRDRVPALLEPGEFVIRRPAAKAAGGPALNALNATGKMPGNVEVNIKNEGTPQEATASQPRFDGEKFVIDIVTRDLRNNGPIRKSLRGGGA